MAPPTRPGDDAGMTTIANTTLRVRLGGLLGEALEANRRGRLSTFIVDETSPAIALFAPALRARNAEGDWYGEHAGKWLVAAARAAARSGDDALRGRVLRVAHWLASVQEDDGYLGTYAPERRFMRPQPPAPETWDGAPALRTWDVWTHAYLVLGLLEVHRRFDDAASLEAARRIGLLCHAVFVDGGMDVTTLGNHFGLSATVLLEPALELHASTGDARFLALAQALHAQAESHPRSAIVARALEGADVSEIATGKAYQLLWNLVGIAKLHRATRQAHLLDAVLRLWARVRDSHLTPGGGPWGGVAHRSREVFNAPNAFDPNGYVETCSVLAWLQLNRVLLDITGDPRHAAEIERSAYNDLLGAQAPNGEDWCYYGFANGRRVHTTYWRCCKSSGAMALEELPESAASLGADGELAIHVHGPLEVAFDVAPGRPVRLRQATGYPYDGTLTLQLDADEPLHLALRLRVPDWAERATLSVAGAPAAPVDAQAGYVHVGRDWEPGDVVVLRLPMPPRLLHGALRNIQESRAPDGSPVAQQVLFHPYVALARGPLVYATGLLDGYKSTESLLLPQPPESAVSELGPAEGSDEPRLRLAPLRRAPIDFVPAFLADGRRDGGWRLTWMALAPDDLPDRA
jgi:DUF1680 family protein